MVRIKKWYIVADLDLNLSDLSTGRNGVGTVIADITITNLSGKKLPQYISTVSGIFQLQIKTKQFNPNKIKASLLIGRPVTMPVEVEYITLLGTSS